jgi:gluconate 5-dehydrogenase
VECIALKCDVTDSAQVTQTALEVEKLCGKVDILVNCAGSAENAGVIDMTDEQWDFTIKTDLKAFSL